MINKSTQRHYIFFMEPTYYYYIIIDHIEYKIKNSMQRKSVQCYEFDFKILNMGQEHKTSQQLYVDDYQNKIIFSMCQPWLKSSRRTYKILHNSSDVNRQS